MKMTGPKKLGLGCLAIGAVAVLGGGFWWSRSEWIEAGNVGLIYNANGGLERNNTISPRRVFVGWRQKLYTYPTMLKNAVYTQDPDEGESKAADGVLVTTKDNQNTVFDISVIYRVKKEDVVKVFDNFGALPIDEIQRQHIRRALKEAANNISTQYDVFELMGAKRLEASQKLTAEMQRLLSYKGLDVQLAMFGVCEPDAGLQAKINARVNANTDLEISKLRAQIADIDRQTAVIRAESENQARKLSASKTQASSLEMLDLQSTEAAIDRWNGSLPPIQARPGQTLVIGGNELSTLGQPETGGRRGR